MTIYSSDIKCYIYIPITYRQWRHKSDFLFQDLWYLGVDELDSRIKITKNGSNNVLYTSYIS